MARLGLFRTVVALMVLVAYPVMAADHYVRPAGSYGSGNGSDWTNACSGFSGACSPGSMVRGDTYYVASGSYPSLLLNRAASGSLVITIKKATIADHGTGTGWSDSMASGSAKLQQGSTSEALMFGSPYWVVDGVTGGGPGNWKSGFGFVLDASRKTSPVSGGVSIFDNTGNIIIRHVEILGNGGDGTPTSGQNDGLYCGNNNPGVLLEYAWVHDTGRTNLFVRCSGFTTRYSWICCNESTPSEHSEHVSAWSGSTPNTVQNLVFAYNVWQAPNGTGGIVMSVDGADVYGNVFLGGGEGGGNGLVTTWSSDNARNVRVYNNSFVNCNYYAVNFPDSESTGNVAFNNIFYNSNPGFSNVAQHSYNWYYGSGGTYGESNAQSGTGNPFVNITSDDFRLTAATNPGTALPAPYDRDPLGVVRGADGTWDRGAYEFPPQVSPPTNLRIDSIQ